MIRKEIVLPAPREEVWEALTDADRLEEWFANDVTVDLRPGGGASFGWSNGESRTATLVEVDPERRLAFEWDDEGEVSFTLADDDDGTRPAATETDPAWTTALDLQASALACVLAPEPGLRGARRPQPPPGDRPALLPWHGDRNRVERRAADDAPGRGEASRDARRRRPGGG